MKTEILKIAKELEIGEISEIEAKKLLTELLYPECIYNENDMSTMWSEGYHRRTDEINGNKLRYFNDCIESIKLRK